MEQKQNLILGEKFDRSLGTLMKVCRKSICWNNLIALCTVAYGCIYLHWMPSWMNCLPSPTL